MYSTKTSSFLDTNQKARDRQGDLPRADTRPPYSYMVCKQVGPGVRSTWYLRYFVLDQVPRGLVVKAVD